jgi:hypothetical protein
MEREGRKAEVKSGELSFDPSLDVIDVKLT